MIAFGARFGAACSFGASRSKRGDLRESYAKGSYPCFRNLPWPLVYILRDVDSLAPKRYRMKFMFSSGITAEPKEEIR